MKQIFLTPLFILFFFLASCEFGPNSGRGFSLPEGSVDNGRATFVELECNACHSVGDIEHISGRDGHDIDIELGGQVASIKTYGDLLTSVINPSYKISWHYAGEDLSSEVSKMELAAYNEEMTVQQLVDLVTYLESNYELVHPTRSEYARYRVEGG